MATNKFYSTLAEYYDAICDWKDYKNESKVLCKIIKQNKRNEGIKLLDIACGTGSHLTYLKKHYKVTGLDLSTKMLKLAKKKSPEIRLIQADMKSFNLKGKFDIITCLFGSIAYLRSYKEIRDAIRCFAKHLNSGGVLLIEPFINKEVFTEGIISARFVDKPKTKIARMNLLKKKDEKAVLDFHYLIATETGISYFRDKHYLLLLDTKEVLQCLKKQEFKAKFLKKGLMKRGLFVAIKE